jgi:hypothetical protein
LALLLLLRVVEEEVVVVVAVEEKRGPRVRRLLVVRERFCSRLGWGVRMGCGSRGGRETYLAMREA